MTAVDFEGERSAPASASVVGGDRDGAIGSGGGRPPPPANLRSEVYSSTAAEIFWDRADQRGLTYEVSLGRRVIATTDGTSAFFSSLSGARGQTFDVVAIDRNGQRSGAATVALGAGSGGGGSTAPASPPPGGDAPPAPEGLRFERYSTAAGELFWQRVPGAGIRYEVLRDGERLALTDGTSRFIDDLRADVATAYRVRTIDARGRRSDAASVVVDTSGNTGGPTPPSSGVGPSTPAAARLEIYSGTAAELFWDRPVSTDDVDFTSIRRDGTEIGTSEGTSFFDATREPGRRHRYEIVFVDAAGNESDPAVVGGEGGGEPSGPPSEATLSIDRVDAVLSELFALLRAEPFEDFVRATAVLPLPGVDADELDPAPDGATLVNAREVDFVGLEARYACDAGGSFLYEVNAPLQQIDVDHDLDDCRLGDAFFAGRRSTFRSASGLEYAFPGGLSITVPGGGSSFLDGSFRRRNATALPNGSLRWNVASASLPGGPASARFESRLDFDAEAPDPTRVNEFSAVGVVIADWTGGTAVRLQTREAFFRAADDVGYRVGRLVASADDGSTLEIDAADGDPTTFQVTVNENGTISSVTRAWSDAFRLPCVSATARGAGEIDELGCTFVFGALVPVDPRAAR